MQNRGWMENVDSSSLFLRENLNKSKLLFCRNLIVQQKMVCRCITKEAPTYMWLNESLCNKFFVAAFKEERNKYFFEKEARNKYFFEISFAGKVLICLKEIFYCNFLPIFKKIALCWGESNLDNTRKSTCFTWGCLSK